MSEHFVTRLAWEWFLAGSDHDVMRLQDLVLDLAETYGLDDTTLEVVLVELKKKYAARYGLGRLLA